MYIPRPDSNDSQPTKERVARPMEFTPEMLKDQEMLVSTLSQQGIPEALIHRQFNKLLEEQSKQLQFEMKLSRVEEQNSGSRERGGADPPQHQASQQQASVHRKLSASSLLKIRTKREEQDARSRNNGLQDLQTAAQIIDKCKREEPKTAALARFRLNGTQDGKVPECEAFCQAHALRRPTESPPSTNCKRYVSANGLENSRRQAAQRLAQSQVATNELGHESHTSTHENTTCEPTAGANVDCIDRMASQERQQTNHSVTSSSTFPLIQEPRVFGGFTYLARKPQSFLPQFPCNAQNYSQSPQAGSTIRGAS